MEAIADAVVSKAAENLVDSVWRQIGYVWNYNSNIQDLKDKVDKLNAEKKSVLHQVEEAREKGEAIEEIVDRWLTCVDEAIKASKQILDNSNTLHNKCFIGCCPNLKKRYQLSRDANKEAPVVDSIRGERNFNRISYQISAQKLEVIKDYEALNSRMEVLNDIVRALKDADACLIGVCGMGGVGKSTLVKQQVPAKVKEDGIFKVVAIANVNQNPDVNKIQQEIGDWLGLKFDVESAEVRGRRLRARLKQEEKVLVILDNIWGRIKLEAIGIPYDKDHKGCKILMTSRNRNVLVEMGVERKFQFRVNVLQHTEAWQLFEKKVGNLKDPNLQPIATEVAKRCAGLPVLIVAVAVALKDKELYEWKVALERLKRFDEDEMDDQVKSALELSYNFLKGDEIKLLFLICGQIGPNINFGYLLNFAIGIGLFKRATAVEDVRNELKKSLNDLKASSLLLEGSNDEEVYMHEVVLHFAASVASRDRHAFSLALGSVLNKWPPNSELEQCTAITLPFCKIPELCDVFQCPKVESFILASNDLSLKIPDNFFAAMKELKFLDLTKFHLSSLPSSLKFLVNLQTLCLHFCDLEDIAIVGELKKLQVLSLWSSKIIHLPPEIGQLPLLQILDLSNCSSLEVIPGNVLSQLVQLEELYMGNSFVKWKGEENVAQGDNAKLAELKLLPNLVTLQIHITDAKLLPSDFFSEKLERFIVFIGDEWDWFGKVETSRTLKLKLKTRVELERVEVLLKRSEDLYLDDLKGVKNVLYELDRQGFPQLKHLHVQNSKDIRCMVDCTRVVNFIAFPRLESLHVDNLNSMEKICCGQLMPESLSKLRKLKVSNCDALKNLFSFSMFKGLALLEEIDVNGCKIMEVIIGAEDDGIGSKDEVIELKQLRSLTLEYLPRFKSFCSQVKETNAACSEIEIVGESESEASWILFSKKIKFPSMKDLKLSSINVEKIWRNKLTEVSPSIQNLTSLIVEGCANLSYLFTPSMVKNLAQVKMLEISDCNLMGEIIVEKGLGEEVASKISIPRLESLKLKHLPMLIRFCTTNLIECPSLKVLWLESCPLLQTFISNPMSKDVLINNRTEQGSSTLFDETVSFPNLEELHITYMHKLKMIWSNELQADSFCKLKVLEIKHGNELLKIFSYEMLKRFQNVEDLVVENCNLLEEVFDIQAFLNVQERTHVAVANQLRNLKLEHLQNLKHVWSGDPEGILSFCNLRVVEAWSCPTLKSLFPFSIAQDLRQLEKLVVDRCGMEELVTREERADTNPKFVFPQLKNFVLWMSKEVKCFYSSKHTLECPLLESLTVFDCEKLEMFTSEPQDMKEVEMEKQQGPLAQPLFPFEKVVGNVIKLGVNYKDIMKMLEGQVPVEIFHKLKALDLKCSEDASVNFSIFHLLQKFKNLEEVALRCGNFNVLLPYDIVGDGDAGLRQIQSLKLENFPNMKHLWNKDFHVLQNLQTLDIWSCNGLINLVPPSASFQNLTTLYVYKCRTLVNLVSFSTAKSMVNLTSMKVRQCPMVKEIIASEGGESQSQCEIVFNKLATLQLLCLRGLTSFCSSASCNIKFPSLEVVIVSQCPKIKVFSQGILSSPKVKRVYLTPETDKWRWIGNLNTTIKELHKEMIGFSGLQDLKLSEFPELKDVWQGHLPVNFFYNLSSLVVDECAFPSCSVPSNLLPFLSNLEELVVRNCDTVEHVFGLEWSNASGFVGYLSKLNKLHLIDLPRLRLLWNEIPKGNFDFQNLQVLKVCSCSSLRYILTPTMCSGLVRLKELGVKSCKMVEEIITSGSEMENIVLPLLKSIALESLPRLINLSSESGILQCPSLEEISVVDCPTTFTSSFLRETEPNATHEITEPKVFLPNLKDLKLSSVNVEKIWHTQMLEVSSSIKNLTSLTVDGCSNLQYALSSSMVKSVIHLQKIEICNCKMMKEVIVMDRLEEEMMGKMSLEELVSLELKDLPRLARFCTSNSIECPVMKELLIENCPELRTFISNSASLDIAASSKTEKLNSTLFDDKVEFPSLEKFGIFRMSGVKAIWGDKLHDSSFRKLEALDVREVKQLINVFPDNLVRRFQNLTWLGINGCDALQEVFDIQGLRNGEGRHAVTATQLKTLYIWKLPNLKHVWNEDPQGILEFQSLCLVSTSACPSLKHLFPAAIATSLLHLEQLEIVDCGIEEIVAEDQDRIEAPAKFDFPYLHSLILRKLPQLKRFFPGAHTIHWPVLKNLSLSGCGGIQIFASEFQSLQEQGREEALHMEIEQPLFPITKVNPNLEQLALSSKDVTMICQGQLLMDFSHKLKVLELNFSDDKSAAFPYHILQRFNHLEALVVVGGKFKELISHGKLVSKEKLKIVFPFLSNLKNTWHKDSQPLQVLQSLESLMFMDCDELISIAPSFASFKSLTTLDAWKCKGLVSLVASSTAKSLVHLRRLTVVECNALREIVSGDGYDTKDEIIFIKLEILELHCLPCLASFSSGNECFKFPSLIEVVVSQCPQMQVFSKAAVSTPVLQRVRLTKEKNKECWYGNLNTTVKHLFTRMIGFQGLQQLKLSEFLNLKDRWHDELPVELFYDLRSLVVDICAVSSNAIPSNLLMFLNNLEELEVRNCEALEEILGVEGPTADQGQDGLLSQLRRFFLIDLPRLVNIWSQIHQGALHLKNLTSLKVHNCSSLRIICTRSMAQGLIHLQEMEVKNCISLEEIITEGVGEVGRDEIIFPLLNSLVLESLPNLITFYSGSEILECLSLEKITAMDCPKIEIFASTISAKQELNKINEGTEERVVKGYNGIASSTRLFCGKVKCPGLKELRLEWNKIIEEIWNGNFLAAEFFSNLNVLELTSFPTEYVSLQSNFLQKFPNLEKFIVDDACFEEIFPQEASDGEKHSGEVTKLRQLKLSKLPQLRHLMKDKQSKPGSLVENLEALQVSECSKLETLVPPFMCFKNLTTLEVSKCHGIVHLIASSAAGSLVHLMRMSLTECEMVVEVVLNEGDDMKDEVVFSQLKNIELHCLPSLKSFCSGNCTFKFPSLEEVIVRECPRMACFVQRDFSTPKLKSVQITEDEDEWLWDGSLNTTMHNLSQKW